jgi:hypothetical protein
MAAATPAATITAARAMIRAAVGLIFGTGRARVFPVSPRIITNFPFVAGKNDTWLTVVSGKRAGRIYVRFNSRSTG